MTKLLSNWKFVITFVILETIAIIGALPLIKTSYIPLFGGAARTRYNTLWDSPAALVAFMVIASVLTFYFTRSETRNVRAGAFGFVIGILLVTALTI